MYIIFLTLTLNLLPSASIFRQVACDLLVAFSPEFVRPLEFLLMCVLSETATSYLHLRERCWKRRIRLCHSSFHSMTIERRLTVSPGCSPSFSLPKIRYDLQQEQVLIKNMYNYGTSNNYMKDSGFWEASSHSARQEFPLSLRFTEA